MREEILKLLSEKEMTVTDLAKALNVSKATISHHLERLKAEGLVRVAREERVKNFVRRYYTLSVPQIDLIIKLVKSLNDRNEFLRNYVRILGLSLLKVSPHLFKKAGFELGYALSFKNAELEDLAEIWSKLKLGETSCSRDSLTVEDCYFCSGLPKVGRPYCRFDEGVIAGFLKRAKGENYKVEEVKCWGLGDEICEFKIKRI